MSPTLLLIALPAHADAFRLEQRLDADTSFSILLDGLALQGTDLSSAEVRLDTWGITLPLQDGAAPATVSAWDWDLPPAPGATHIVDTYTVALGPPPFSGYQGACA